MGDTENQQGNLNQGGCLSPDSSLSLKGDQSYQDPVEVKTEEPALCLAELPRRGWLGGKEYSSSSQRHRGRR